MQDFDKAAAVMGNEGFFPPAVEDEQAKWQIVEQLVGKDHADKRLGRQLCPRLDALRMSGTLIS